VKDSDWMMNWSLFFIGVALLLFSGQCAGEAHASGSELLEPDGKTYFYGSGLKRREIESLRPEASPTPEPEIPKDGILRLEVDRDSSWDNGTVPESSWWGSVVTPRGEIISVNWFGTEIVWVDIECRLHMGTYPDGTKVDSLTGVMALRMWGFNAASCVALKEEFKKHGKTP